MSDQPTVHQAWAAVMADVRELAKGDRNNHFNFNFRGIDAVMNAVGPVLRRHQVAVVPTLVDISHRDVQTSKGKPAHESTVVVTYTVYGPQGDSFAMQAPGESMDDGDKGTAKAMSVAMRTVLLQSLCLPTQDTDPDAESYERAAAPTQDELAQQVEAGVTDATTEAEVREWGNRAHGKGLLDYPTPHGTIREYVTKRLAELAPAQDGSAA